MSTRKSTATMPNLNESASPWSDAPALIFWELTRACGLSCRHCRAEPNRERLLNKELSTEAIIETLNGIGEQTSAVVVFTGGDPFRRPDLPEIVEACSKAGLKPAITPSTTPLLDYERMERLRDAGLKMVALSLDGHTREAQNSFRGEDLTYQYTMEGVDIVSELGLPLQINTTVCKETLPYLREIGETVSNLPVFRWALFFLVETGHGTNLESVSPEDTEEIFSWLHEWHEQTGIQVKTTNAPHFKRWKLQNTDATARPGIIDGDGILFISHTGNIFPSGFCESEATKCGNARVSDPLEIYRRHPLFQHIRSRKIKGKCGDCEFLRACGGSRANALAETGDPLESDPRCLFQPGESS